MGLIIFGSDVKVISPLTSMNRKLQVAINLIKFHDAMGSTNMDGALQLACVQLSKGRQGVSKVIILISDGLPDYPDRTLITSGQLKTTLDYTICTILVNADNTNEEFLTQLASPGGYVRTDYEHLAQVIAQLDICL